MEQQSYLSDMEFSPVYATVGQRFLNHLIDLISYYVFLFCVGLSIGALGGGEALIASQSVGATYLLAFCTYLTYFFLTELILNGRTVGKLITGTKVVNEDGTHPEPKTFFLRALSRFVPFEPFSAFGGHPWHDRWTRTHVIDVKKTALANVSVEM